MPTTNDTSRSIAAAVSAALQEADLSQRAVAEQTGIPLVTLSRRLTGKKALDTDQLSVLAELLQMRVSELIARAERAA